MTIHSMHELLVSQLRDIYNAEQQLLFAGPRMADAATNSALTTTIRDLIADTGERMSRLEACFRLLGEPSGGERCAAMEGLLKEATRSIKRVAEPSVLDAAIIAGLQRVEHYEITAYGTAAAFARLLGEPEIARILEASLAEEKAADKALSGIAETEVNIEALAATHSHAMA